MHCFFVYSNSSILDTVEVRKQWLAPLRWNKSVAFRVVTLQRIDRVNYPRPLSYYRLWHEASPRVDAIAAIDKSANMIDKDWEHPKCSLSIELVNCGFDVKSFISGRVLCCRPLVFPTADSAFSTLAMSMNIISLLGCQPKYLIYSLHFSLSYFSHVVVPHFSKSVSAKLWFRSLEWFKSNHSEFFDRRVPVPCF